MPYIKEEKEQYGRKNERLKEILLKIEEYYELDYLDAVSIVFNWPV